MEIYLKQPEHRRRAIPELARLAHTLDDAPAARWAREQLAALKAELPPE